MAAGGDPPKGKGKGAQRWWAKCEKERRKKAIGSKSGSTEKHIRLSSVGDLGEERGRLESEKLTVAEQKNRPRKGLGGFSTSQAPELVNVWSS